MILVWKERNYSDKYGHFKFLVIIRSSLLRMDVKTFYLQVFKQKQKTDLGDIHSEGNSAGLTEVILQALQIIKCKSCHVKSALKSTQCRFVHRLKSMNYSGLRA